MSGEKKDLRYSRTDRLLQEAFLELLKVKSVDRITIRDLTERAGINRCTFYHHYQDIYDLLEQIEDGVMEHVLEMMRGFHPNREEDVSRRYFECFCQYIYENRTVYCVLTNGQESRFIKKLLKMISEYMAGLSGKENDGDKLSREYAVAYSIGGVVGVLHKWMKEGFESPPEMVAGFISNVFLNGMKDLL